MPRPGTSVDGHGDRHDPQHAEEEETRRTAAAQAHGRRLPERHVPGRAALAAGTAPRKTSLKRPIRMSCPWASSASSTAMSFTYVPLSEPRSTIRYPPASVRTSAWRLESLTPSSTMVVAVELRPSEMTPSANRYSDPAPGPRVISRAHSPSRGRTARSCGRPRERSATRRATVSSAPHRWHRDRCVLRLGRVHDRRHPWSPTRP